MLLPMEALEWNDTWLMAALRHESAHIRRHDYLARWMAQLACAIYWPNPFVWLLARSLRLAQEQAADDLVLRAGTPAEEYATQLVEAARMVATQGFFVRQAVAMACPSTLEHRVRAIVDGRSKRHPLSVLAASLGSLAAVAVLALSAAAQLRSEEAGAKDAAPAPAGRSSEPVVEIEAKFIESNPEELKIDAPVRFDEPVQVFTDPQFQIIMRELSRKKGVNLLSSPRMTTKSKQRSTVEVTREFRYAKDWEKNPAGWKGKDFAVKNLGVTLEATPEVQADGTIALKLKAEEIGLAGFQDLDNPGPISGEIDGEHKRAEPVFARGAVEKTVTLKDGETVLLTKIQQLVDGKPLKESEHPRRLYVFVTARVLGREPQEDAEAQTPSASAQPDAKPQATVAELEAQLKVLNALRPDQLGEALKVLKIEDATVTRNLPLLQDTMAEDARLAGLGLAEDHPRRKALREQEATYRKILSDQLAAIQHLQSNRVRWAKDRAGIVTVAEQQPAGTPAADAKAMITKEWKVPTNLIPLKPGGDGVERQSAKDWLVANGVQFEGNATATYIIQSSRLIVRNTADELNLVDQIIAKEASALPPAPGADITPVPSEEGPTMAKAKSIIIPKFDLREANLAEALEALRAKAKEFDPEKKGVNLVVKPGVTSNAQITLSLSNIPVIEAVHYITGLADLEFEIQPEAIVILPVKAKAAGLTPQAVEFDGFVTYNKPITSAGENATGLTITGGTIVVPIDGNGTAGATINLNGGTFQFAQDSPQSAGAAKSEAAKEPGKVKEDAEPVEITADATRMENSIAVAEGNATLKWGEQTIKADQIRYDPATRQVDLTGNVEIKNGAIVQKADRLTLWLTPDGRMKIHGPHEVSVSQPPVAVTLAPKGTFKGSDGIEIRETTGSSPTFRVGGTYRVRGVCRQSSVENASLFLSNTAEGDGEAIKPLAGTALSKVVPKGFTEFEFAFTPTRPGKLHITIYDNDNRNPVDNAYAGVYLGDVAP